MVVLGVGRGGAAAEAVLVSNIITRVLPCFPVCWKRQGRAQTGVTQQSCNGCACETLQENMRCFETARTTYARFLLCVPTERSSSRFGWMFAQQGEEGET